MKIGIIGEGNIGGNLTRRLTAATGAQAVPVTGAAAGAEVVVVTMPRKNVPDLPAGVLDGAADGVQQALATAFAERTPEWKA